MATNPGTAAICGSWNGASGERGASCDMANCEMANAGASSPKLKTACNRKAQMRHTRIW